MITRHLAATTPLCLATILAGSVATAQTSFDVSAGYATESLYQNERFGFDAGAFASVGITGQAGVLQYRLSLGTNEDSDLLLDGSYVQLDAGNWVYGFGQIDRNWGPSRFSSIIMSSNARPHPTVYIRKENATAFNLPVLEWLGPWDFETFFGQLEEDRATPNAKTFGMRVGINPAPGLTINFERTAQWGGGDRPEDFEAIFSMIFGDTNSTGADPDAANQIAGISFSYDLPPSIAPVRIYGQIAGEDEAANLPIKFMHLAGVELDMPVGGVPSLFTLEMIDTRIDSLGQGSFPNIAYENRFYPSGYTYEGRVMGVPIDTDGFSLRLSGAHVLDELTVDWGLAQVSINEFGTLDHRLSSVPVSGVVADLGGSYDFGNGMSLRAGVSYQDFDLDTAGISEGLSGSVLLSRTF
ncbi:capsule assembly Wzi family protein [Flavimaricola marinus]|uniref:Autotransporter domain-containing protein n=1 Tax=Flavimaricola marinus TaxID=1819565 RepID=A0A238LAQ0_9RHOB|nr:capsule assembly Wzi family protein [Flavimaricola marinus]SMY06797.1 hypothetical protein LOM8899_00927 [Flavimaricola marinus]